MSQLKKETRPGSDTRTGDKATFRRYEPNYQNPPVEATERVQTVRVGKAILKQRVVPAGPRSLALMRQREVERLITARHGGVVPDPLDTDDRDTALTYAQAVAFSLTGQLIADWSARWAPWMLEDEIVAIEWEARQRGRALRADAIARLLGVTYEERMRLNFRTIGSCDLSRAERDMLALERKRKHGRERQDRISRQKGRKIRIKGQPKPWETEGISERTYYRRKAWQSNIANKNIITTCDKSLPSSAPSLNDEKKGLKTEGHRPRVSSTPSQHPRGARAERKSVPRPQALVAEGSLPQGMEGSEARIYDNPCLKSESNDRLTETTLRRTA